MLFDVLTVCCWRTQLQLNLIGFLDHPVLGEQSKQSSSYCLLCSFVIADGINSAVGMIASLDTLTFGIYHI